MNRLRIGTILAMVLVGSVAFAAPFLVADTPLPEQKITHYNIYKNGVLEGTFEGETLNYDLVGVAPGAYDWTAEACNVWECEITPDPYISPSAATSPLNLNGIP